MSARPHPTVRPARRLDRAQLELFGRLAHAGHTVVRRPDGAFQCTRLGLIRHCENFDALERFAVWLGVWP
jgi:hypothetical protein